MKIKISKLLYVFCLLILIGFQDLFSQDNGDYFSYDNRLDFGNHLFCQKDYLRAIGEYNWLQSNSWKDSIQFKIGVAYSKMNKFNEAYTGFELIDASSQLYLKSEIEKIRILYFMEDYNNLNAKIEKINSRRNNLSQELLQLNNSVMLLCNLAQIEEDVFLEPFNADDKYKILSLYSRKVNEDYKSPTKAVILSTLIPGLGKVYADETSDGVTSFLLTGIFTYLAVNKFQNSKISSGILYASIATFFYAGNIYGSASAVRNYNAGLKISFNKDVKIFINERNQFLPIPKYLCD